jgi:archaellum component FlaC
LKRLSLLFVDADQEQFVKIAKPVYFHDLNLDKVISHIVDGREEYKLNQYFYNLNKNLEQIQYRQEIMKDFEEEKVYKTILSYSKYLADIRNTLDRIENLYYPLQQQRC